MQGLYQPSQKLLKHELKFYNYLIYSCFKACANPMENKEFSQNDEKCFKSCCRKMLISYELVKKIATSAIDSKHSDVFN